MPHGARDAVASVAGVAREGTDVTTLAATRGVETAARSPVAGRRMFRLTELKAGETGRIVRVHLPDLGCRRRFGELGLAEGMEVTVQGDGETLMLSLCGGKMGLAARCACDVWVMRK